MKLNKLIAGVLSLCIMGGNFTAVTAGAAADVVASGQCGDNAFWSLDSEGTLTVTGTGGIYDYETHSMSYGLTGLVNVEKWYNDTPTPWFEQRSEIRKIVVSEGIEALGESCFMDCDNLEEVQLPDTLTLIGYDSFFHCDILRNIDIPDSVTTIHSGAFRRCASIDGIKLPKKLTALVSNVFEDCGSITMMEVPSAITSIGYGVFSDCPVLKAVVITNPDCKIYEKYNVFDGSDSCTIYGWSGSTAQAYAELYGMPFMNIEDMSIGDVNLDGAVDSIDASQVLAEYANTSTGGSPLFYGFQQPLADVNTDSAVDSSDASTILSYYAYTATGGTQTFEEYLGI